MTDDPADLVDAVRGDVTDRLTVEWEPIGSGKVRLTAEFDGETIENGHYTRKIFSETSVRGQFLNSVTESIEDREDEETAEVQRLELKEWFADMGEKDLEESDEMLPPHIRQVLDGTQCVEIHGGEPTTVHVTLSYDGRTCDLEFTADEMTAGGGALVSRMANHFFIFDFECEDPEWNAIRERWQERAEVVAVVEETGEDTVAERVLEFLGHNIVAVAARDDLDNGPESAWVDSSNATGTDVAPPEAPIVWVEKTFLIDQLELVGKKTEYLGQLIKTLNRRGDLYGVETDGRKRWPNSLGKDRAKFYAFDPDALGVNPDDVGDVDEPAHGEVAP